MIYVKMSISLQASAGFLTYDVNDMFDHFIKMVISLQRCAIFWASDIHVTFIRYLMILMMLFELLEDVRSDDLGVYFRCLPFVLTAKTSILRGRECIF